MMLKFSAFMLPLAIFLSSCSSQGDQYSKDAGLTIDKDGFAYAKGSMKSLAESTLAFRMESSAVMSRGSTMDSIKFLPQKYSSVAIISHGNAFVCMYQKAAAEYLCTKSEVTYNAGSDSVNFDISSSEKSESFMFAHEPTAVTEGLNGDIIIPANAITMNGYSDDPALLGNLRVNKITYVKRGDLESYNLVDLDGKKVDISENKELASASRSDNSDSNSSKLSNDSKESIKRQVISKIATDHNMSPDDVTDFSAEVTPLEVTQDRKSGGSHISGQFTVKSNSPSNLNDAIRAHVNDRLCSVDSNRCNSNGFTHVIYFDANASVYEKLDGTSAFKIDYTSSVDKSLSPAEKSKIPDDLQQAMDRKDYTTAISLLRPLATQGDAGAQNLIGLYYDAGLGVPQDYKQAFFWYQKAAVQGNASAQYHLGWLYRTGSGVLQDYAQALAWYQKAADQNNSDAESDLGWLFQNGHGVTQDFAQALAWYQKASDQGNAQAENNLGSIYEIGQGVPQDYVKAQLWFQKSALQDNADAQNNLGTLYDSGKGVTQDYSQALAWYQKSAAQGNSIAQDGIGRLYYYGHGMPQDYGLSFTWFQKAAIQGNVDAQRNLGWLYQNGHGVPQDYSQALAWFQKAADRGDADAQSGLGIMYEMGSGVPQNYAQAFALFQKAATQGSNEAQFRLGQMYEVGHGIPQDYVQALAWYQKAAVQGNANAQSNLGVLFETGHGSPIDYAQALSWYKKSADQGNSYAQDNIGSMFESGHGVPQDYAQALVWYQKAADQGNADAQNNIKSLHEHGHDSSPNPTLPVATPAAQTHATKDPSNIAASSYGISEGVSGGPSFDCQKANSVTDSAICADATLARLDVQLAQIYRRAVAQSPPDNAQMLKDSQRAWLRMRGQACGSDRSCIEEKFNQRIAELNR